jgi:hypothetical protein
MDFVIHPASGDPVKQHEHKFRAFNPFHPQKARCSECGMPYDELGPFAKRRARLAAYQRWTLESKA